MSVGFLPHLGQQRAAERASRLLNALPNPILAVGEGGRVFEVEENYLDEKLKSVSVYYGPLFRSQY